MNMKNSINQKGEYYLNTSIEFFENNFDKRLKFLKSKSFLFNEISGFINHFILFKKIIRFLRRKFYNYK